VAHNFNNMLAVVLPNLDMALEETRGDTQLMLREARQATQNAAELVRQLMRIARSEPDAPPESVDLVTVVRDVGALLRRTLGSSMRLNIELPEDKKLRVRGVASDLNMVLLNLCFNARDAMQSRIGAELGIKLSENEQELVLEVRDNGLGMTDATLQRLGQPFFTTKQPGAGTGLGLATVYGLVSSLGGHVEVESRLGHGSTFRVCLPRGAAQTVPPPGPDPKPKRLDGLRVLVIEDEAFVREAIRRLLLSVGAEVDVAADGDGGLARLEVAAADAVLLDLNMPGTPGLQVLAELRARAPELPVVVLTGHASESPALSAADTVLVKPVLRAALVDAILGAYGKRPPPAGRASA
jgi:CheY-like chemotaxis protein